MNLKEVSEYLGIGETKTRELLRDRNCPFSMKIGYRWYANKKILDKWVQEQSEKKGEIILFDMYVSKWYSVRSYNFV